MELTEHTITTEEKREEVKAWMKKVNFDRYVDLDDNDTLTDCFKRMKSSQERERDVRLVMDFQRHQMKEYEAENVEMERILETCGVKDPEALALAELVAQAADLLGIDNPSPDELELSLMELRLKAVKASLETRFHIIRQEKVKAEELESIKKLTLSEAALNYHDAEEKAARSSLEQMRDKTPFLVAKQKEYLSKIDKYNAVLKRNGFRKEISHVEILRLKTQLDDLNNDQLNPLRKKLEAYHDLPPDFELAQAKLAEAEKKLADLSEQFMKEVNALHL